MKRNRIHSSVKGKAHHFYVRKCRYFLYYKDINLHRSSKDVFVIVQVWVLRPCLLFMDQFDPSQSYVGCCIVEPLCGMCSKSFGQRTKGFIATLKQISVRRHLCILRRNDHIQILTASLDRPLL